MSAHQFIVYYQQKTSRTWRRADLWVPVAKNIRYHNAKQLKNCDVPLAKPVVQNQNKS